MRPPRLDPLSAHRILRPHVQFSAAEKADRVQFRGSRQDVEAFLREQPRDLKGTDATTRIERIRGFAKGFALGSMPEECFDQRRDGLRLIVVYPMPRIHDVVQLAIAEMT